MHGLPCPVNPSNPCHVTQCIKVCLVLSHMSHLIKQNGGKNRNILQAHSGRLCCLVNVNQTDCHFVINERIIRVNNSSF